MPTRSPLDRMLLAPVRRPKPTLVLAVIAVVAAAVSASRIEPATSLEPMFAGDDPASQAMLRVLHDFSAADTLLILVEAPGVDDPHDAERRLTAFAERLAAEVEADADAAAMTTGVVFRPGEVARSYVEDVLAPAGLYFLSEEEFEAFRTRLQPEEIRAQIARNEALLTAGSPAADALSHRVLQDPLRLHEFLIRSMAAAGGGMQDAADPDRPLLGADGRSLLIRIGAVESASELEFTKRFMATMRGVIERARPGELTVSLTGGYPIAEISERVIRSDMIRGTVCSVVLLQILFLVAYRSPWSFPLTFLPLFSGILVGFGLHAVYSTRLTPVIAASGAILAGLGVDYCIHYLSDYGSRRGAGLPPPAAAEQSSRGLGAPLSAACVTSLLGFLAVGASRVPALQEFALVGALALGSVFIASLAVLPALLQVADRRPLRQGSPLRFGLDPLVAWLGRHARGCVAATALVALAAGVLVVALGPVRFEPDMKTLHPRPSPPMDAAERLGELFPGAMESVQVYLQARTPEELVRLAQAVDRRLAAMPMVRAGDARLLSIGGLLPDPAMVPARRAAIEGIDADRVIADLRAAVDASIFDPAAYEGYIGFLREVLGGGETPDLRTLARHPRLAELLLPRAALRPDAPAPTQAITLVDFRREFTDAGERLAAHAAMRDALADLPGANPTGFEIVTADVERTIRHDLRWLGPLAAAAVVVWLSLVFRRPGAVLLAGVPVVFALVCLLAFLVVTGVRLNVVNLIALPLLAGITVDNGIFLVSIARQWRAAGPERLAEAMGASCHAITMTSLTTLLAFGSLMLTRTPAISSLGLLLTAGMICCWVGTMFLLTPLLIALSRRRAAANSTGGAA